MPGGIAEKAAGDGFKWRRVRLADALPAILLGVVATAQVWIVPKRLAVV